MKPDSLPSSLNAIVIWLLLFSEVGSFTTTARRLRPTWGLQSTPTSDSVETSSTEEADVYAVRAPLKYIGPYPCLALRFPHLATSAQRARNLSGISLDFVLDTAANTNTINAQVAQELQLPVVGQALPGVGTAGLIQGGQTFLLGDAELDGTGQNFTFMTGLTASALAIASPTAAGLLSLAFLQSLDGVEFDWGSPERPASMTFFGKTPQTILETRTKVPIERIPITQLPSVRITINGVEMPALLDTGSPITVLNAQAAHQARIETIPDPNESSGNPLAEAWTRSVTRAQAAARGGVLTIFGAGGKQVNLLRSTESVTVKLSAENDDSVDFGAGNVYVGDLPGLAALNGIGVQSPPAVVLGMDVLRRLPKMLLRAQYDEIWF